MPTAFDKEIKLLEKWKKKNPETKRKFAEWRRIWKAKGPILFAEEILRRDPESGGKLLLSEDQKRFLYDVSKGGVKLAIIVAGRGAGKTFALAVYVTWRIFTHEFWGISCMGGSAEQSAKIHKYVSFWVRDCKDLKRYCMKCFKKEVKTYSDSYVSFLACSATSVRGPHTMELIIDEEAAGEERGKTSEIKAALFQVTTSSDMHIIKSSTCQWIHGDFLNTLNNAKQLGYKKYQWAIAKHKSGEKDIYKVFQDANPNNWESNVPWIPDSNIKILRRNRSNDEWLVEVLGGVSRSSGLVFNPADLEACICRRCPEEFDKPCKPYKEGYCPIIQYYMQLGGMKPKKIPHSTEEALHRIGLRMFGIDWGKNAPCAYTITGKFGKMVFVLESQELTGLSDDQKINIAIGRYNNEGKLIEDGMAQKWHIDTLRPDPEEWAFNNILTSRGFAVHQLFSFEGGKEKSNYLFTLKRLIERHQLVIPCAFKDLIRSLRNLAYDKHGKIRKIDDHSFDSLLYATSYYGEIEEEIEFWKILKETKKSIKKEKKSEIKEEEGVRKVNEDVFIIEDFEAWVKKQKEKKKKKEDEGEFPWGEGADVWK